MTSAYMSLETLAVTLDMPPREVKRLVAHNMLPQPIQIGGLADTSSPSPDCHFEQAEAKP